MFDSVLIADRGALAGRIVRTCQRLGVTAVTVHSEADATARYVAAADESVLLGPAAPAQPYLDSVKLVEAARQAGAQAVHPGGGPLAGSAGFARAVQEAGLTWVGPGPAALEAMADPASTRRAALAAGLPGPPEVPLDRSAPAGRQVAVPILGGPDGRVVPLGERSCPVRRHGRPVVEEAPSPGIGAELRAGLLEAARALGEAVGYANAGTVRFLVAAGRVTFVELSPRLPVGHPVTELVHDVDLVEQQLRIASGQDLPGELGRAPTGHAIGLRLYADDAAARRPGPGRPGPVRITRWDEPAGDGVRVDSGYRRGDEVDPTADPLLATLAVWGADRAEAVARSRAALAAFGVDGPSVDLTWLAELLATPAFGDGSYGDGRSGAPCGKAAG